MANYALFKAFFILAIFATFLRKVFAENLKKSPGQQMSDKGKNPLKFAISRMRCDPINESKM